MRGFVRVGVSSRATLGEKKKKKRGDKKKKGREGEGEEKGGTRRGERVDTQSLDSMDFCCSGLIVDTKNKIEKTKTKTNNKKTKQKNKTKNYLHGDHRNKQHPKTLTKNSQKEEFS